MKRLAQRSLSHPILFVLASLALGGDSVFPVFPSMLCIAIVLTMALRSGLGPSHAKERS